MSTTNTNAGIGDLGWNTIAQVSATDAAVQKQAASAGAIGHVRILSPSLNTSAFFYLYLGNPDSGIIAMADWKEFTWRVRFDTDAFGAEGVGLYSVITDDGSGPEDGVYFQASGGNIIAGAQHGFSASSGDTGVAVGSGWHDCRVVQVSSSSIQFYVDGALVFTATTHLPTLPLMPAAFAECGGFGIGFQTHIDLDDFILIPV